MYIYVQHPPFIFRNVIKPNATDDESSQDKKEVCQDGCKYKGFSIDMIEELMKRYKAKHGEDFPKYKFKESAEFTSGKGFGYKEMKKAGASKDESEGEAEMGGVSFEYTAYVLLRK